MVTFNEPTVVCSFLKLFSQDFCFVSIVSAKLVLCDFRPGEVNFKEKLHFSAVCNAYGKDCELIVFQMIK